MPQCPKCHAAVWAGQQYCTCCTSPLPRPEGEEYFCPQCGDRLATQEEVCQKCQNPAPEIPKIPLTVPERSWKFPLGVPGIFLGAGLIAAALFLVFLYHNNSVPPQPVVAPPPQAGSGATPPAPIIPAAAPKPKPPAVAEVQKPPVTPKPAVVNTPAETPPPTKTISTANAATTTTTKPLPKYFVNIEELSVREGPDTSSPRIAVLQHKEVVELLEISGGWGKVRNEERHILGWSYMRYLQPAGAGEPLGASRHHPADSQQPATMSAKANPEIPQ